MIIIETWSFNLISLKKDKAIYRLTKNNYYGHWWVNQAFKSKKLSIISKNLWFFNIVVYFTFHIIAILTLLILFMTHPNCKYRQFWLFLSCELGTKMKNSKIYLDNFFWFLKNYFHVNFQNLWSKIEEPFYLKSTGGSGVILHVKFRSKFQSQECEGLLKNEDISPY